MTFNDDSHEIPSLLFLIKINEYNFVCYNLGNTLSVKKILRVTKQSTGEHNYHIRSNYHSCL